MAGDIAEWVELNDGGTTGATVQSPGNTVEVQPGESALTGTDTEHSADTIAYDQGLHLISWTPAA